MGLEEKAPNSGLNALPTCARNVQYTTRVASEVGIALAPDKLEGAATQCSWASVLTPLLWKPPYLRTNSVGY